MITVVVPLDRSELAERALRPACALAARLEEAQVLIITCAPGDDDEARTLLDERADQFAEVVDVDTRIVDGADPAEGIVEVVTSMPDSLLCMATHGRSGLRRAVLGSVAEQVLSRSPRPLVLVGPACRTAPLAGERGRMLVCSDGSPFSDTIVPVARSWSAQLQLEPCVAEVVVPDEVVAFPGEPVRNRQVEAASTRLQRLAARLESPGMTTKTEVLHGTPESRSIVDFADRLPATLIAMATHGRSGLARTAMGSVATKVVRHAPCPVLIAKPETTDGH